MTGRATRTSAGAGGFSRFFCLHHRTNYQCNCKNKEKTHYYCTSHKNLFKRNNFAICMNKKTETMKQRCYYSLAFANYKDNTDLCGFGQGGIFSVPNISACAIITYIYSFLEQLWNTDSITLTLFLFYRQFS